MFWYKEKQPEPPPKEPMLLLCDIENVWQRCCGGKRCVVQGHPRKGELKPKYHTYEGITVNLTWFIRRHRLLGEKENGPPDVGESE
jgi:hypothetical protein